jgi:hypothetical protein
MERRFKIPQFESFIGALVMVLIILDPFSLAAIDQALEGAEGAEAGGNFK